MDLNLTTIAQSGVKPFTKVLLVHPEVTKGSAADVSAREAATDEAVLAAGAVRVDVLDLTQLREFSKQKRDRARTSRGGIEIPDNGLALADLDPEEAAVTAAMDGARAKGGSMFNQSRSLGNTDGLEFTGAAIRAVAERVATAQVEKERKAVADAVARAALQGTGQAGKGGAGRGGAGRGAGGRGGAGRGGGRVSWKLATIDISQKAADKEAALMARIRELEAQVETISRTPGVQVAPLPPPSPPDMN
jgi:hypothetical protein